VEQTSLPRIPEIEGLRAIAIALVVLYHFDLPVTGGFFGVDLFFAVSGFVITRQLLHANGPGAYARYSLSSKLGSFYRRRALRLLPNAIAVCGFVILGSFALPSVFGDSRRTIANAVAGLAGVGNWYGIEFPDIGIGEVRPLIHMWSLSIEEQFYLALPLAILPWRNRTRIGATVFGSFAVVISIASAIASVGIQTTFFSTWARVAPIGMGVLVAVLMSSTTTVDWLRSPILRRVAWATLPILLSALTILALTTHWNDVWLTRGGYVAVGFLCAIIVLLSAVGVKSPVGVVLRSRPAQFIAYRSYAIYLWHFPVAFMFVGFGRFPQLVLRLLVAGALTEASLRSIERPLRSTNRFAAAKFAPILMAGLSISLLLVWRLNHA
jgi:peptidoglycan/LPS O-acetylase OafA/YrhL